MIRKAFVVSYVIFAALCCLTCATPIQVQCRAHLPPSCATTDEVDGEQQSTGSELTVSDAARVVFENLLHGHKHELRSNSIERKCDSEMDIDVEGGGAGDLERRVACTYYVGY